MMHAPARVQPVRRRAAGPKPDNAPVAQLDRVPGYEPGGREFESLRARQTRKAPPAGAFFVLCVPDEDEDCCSTKRASVLDAEGAPKG
jgi:hypothetical protein